MKKYIKYLPILALLCIPIAVWVMEEDSGEKIKKEIAQQILKNLSSAIKLLNEATEKTKTKHINTVINFLITAKGKSYKLIKEQLNKLEAQKRKLVEDHFLKIYKFNRNLKEEAPITFKEAFSKGVKIERGAGVFSDDKDEDEEEYSLSEKENITNNDEVSSFQESQQTPSKNWAASLTPKELAQIKNNEISDYVKQHIDIKPFIKLATLVNAVSRLNLLILLPTPNLYSITKYEVYKNSNIGRAAKKNILELISQIKNPNENSKINTELNKLDSEIANDIKNTFKLQYGTNKNQTFDQALKEQIKYNTAGWWGKTKILAQRHKNKILLGSSIAAMVGLGTLNYLHKKYFGKK